MGQSTATVKTEQASRYLQQLCKHWSHKMQTEFDAENGRIVFPSGPITTLSAEPANLEIRIDADDDEARDRLETVVEDHLRRFAFREQLEFAWTRRS